MTFFYDLNKKLKEVADSSKSEHKQLNERANSKAVAEDFGATAAIAGGAALGSALGAVKGRYDDMKYKERGRTFGEPESDWDKPRTTMQRVRAAAGFPSKNDPNVKTKEGFGDVAKKVGAMAKKVGAKALDTLGHGSDEELIKDLQKKVGVPQTGKKPEPTKEELVGGQKKLDRNHNGKLDSEDFAMLRKGKKQTDEGDFGPMEGSTGDYSAKKARAGKDIGKPGKQFAKIAKSAGEKYGSKERGEKVAGAVLAKLRAKESAGEVEEGWDDMLKDVERRRAGMKTGEKVQGHKGEIEKTSTGIKHTRKYDPKTGETDTGDDAPQGEKRRGRPKGTGKAMGAKGPSGKSKLMTKESEHDSAEVKQAIAMLKKAGYKIEKAEEELDEKAVSKAQQRFMGMAHAMQKGEKIPGASKELKTVAKTMKKGDVEDYAKTKHKGLPEKKKKKTEEAGGTDTPTASSGFSFGKGIYDSINREVEEMIAESMNISMNTSSDGPNSLTVTATDEDAAYLAQLLKSAGLGAGEHGGCGCGETPCSCGSDAEHVDENKPDWPTDTETSNDALQYSGGLNKPKTDVAGDGQTTVPVTAVHTQDEDALRRLREMAGIAEAKKDVEEEKTEEGNLFTGNLAKARAAGKKEADLDGDGDMEKVKESILDMKHLWTEYKG